MYSSGTISRNMISSTISGAMLFSTTSDFNHGLEGEFLKSNKDMMASDLFQQQQNHNNGGLMRYRSAPSSFFVSLMDANNANGTSPDDSTHNENEADTMFSSVMNCGNGSSSSNMEIHGLNEANHGLQFSSNSKQERLEYNQQENGFSSEDLKIVYEKSISSNGNGVYGAVMENQMQVRIDGNGNCSSNLIRQSSSPAGFSSGFDEMREVGSFGASNETHAGSNSTSSGLNNRVNFTSRTSAYSRFMPRIAENSIDNVRTGSPDNGNMGNGNNANVRCYVPGFPSDSWNDSASNSLKRNRDDDVKMFSGFNGLENQVAFLDQNKDGSRHFMSCLTHHRSLPKTTAKMAAVEKFLQFQQDVVPCKIRAKRGYATHPRSIAERIRRKRISERMKKLQELFPDMDKQANTADMLDLAVEYIKDLQKQVQTLTDIKAKCACLKDDF